MWQKSQVDPAVKQLQAADKRQDNYMSCFHSIVNGYGSLPDDEALKADALSAKQVFKDFRFSINDGYGAEADKILQMGQNLQPLQEFLTTIGAWQWYIKAAQAATQVRYLLGERAKTKGETVKGELKAARRQTDLAVADLYKTINAMMDLLPSDELTALYTQLKGFELYAKRIGQLSAFSQKLLAYFGNLCAFKLAINKYTIHRALSDCMACEEFLDKTVHILVAAG